MPTTIKFSRPIGKSPFTHLKRHMEIAAACTAHLPQAIDAFFAGDADRLQDSRQQIRRLRSDATRAQEDVQDCLGRSMFLPVDRRDLVAVLDMQALLAERVQEIVGLLLDLLPNVPRQLDPPLRRLVEQCVAATGGVQLVINALEPLVEHGFRGPSLEETRGWIHSVAALEDEAAAIEREVVAALLGQCREMDPVSIVLCYQLVGRVRSLAGVCGKLALRARLLLVR